MKRILVIGASGVGKSTLAQRLSARLGVPFFASDPFYWGPGWQVASAEKVRGQVEAVVCRETWVLDGNFDDQRELVWSRADCILWLDYSLATACRQVALRNLRLVLTREPTWSGNRMTLRRAVSGIRHALRSYPLKKRDYPQWLAGISGTQVYRFHTSRETEAWLRGLDRHSG